MSFSCLVQAGLPIVRILRSPLPGSLRAQIAISRAGWAMGLIAETNNSRERAASARQRRFTVSGREVDLEAHIITADGFQINLTQIECKLLGHLGAHANRTVPSGRLVELLWGRDPKRGAHNLRTVIKNVRRKLEPDPAHPVHLLLDRTRGYRLQLD